MNGYKKSTTTANRNNFDLDFLCSEEESILIENEVKRKAPATSQLDSYCFLGINDNVDKDNTNNSGECYRNGSDNDNDDNNDNNNGTGDDNNNDDGNGNDDNNGNGNDSDNDSVSSSIYSIDDPNLPIALPIPNLISLSHTLTLGQVKDNHGNKDSSGELEAHSDYNHNPTPNPNLNPDFNPESSIKSTISTRASAGTPNPNPDP
jgi:hypothetical protein